MALFKFYHIVRGNSSNRVVVASNLAATVQECQQFVFERLEMSGNKERHHRGGETEISVGDVLLSEGDKMVHSSFLGCLGSLTHQVRVNIHSKTRHSVPTGRGHIDTSNTAAQINQIVGGGNAQTGEDQIYGCLNKQQIIT